MTGPVGSNSLAGSDYLEIGDTSALTPNAALVVIPTDPPSGYFSAWVRPAWWRIKHEGDDAQWVQLTAPSTGTGNQVYSYITVYYLDGATYVQKVEGFPAFQTVKFRASPNTTYYVQISIPTSQSASEVNYALTATAVATVSPGFPTDSTLVTRPAGANNFADAAQMLLGQPASSFNVTALTVEGGEPEIFSTLTETRSCWWKFTPTITGMVEFFRSAGHLSLWTGTEFADLELVENEYRHGTMYAVVEAGVEYHLRWGNGASAGTLTSNSTINVSATLPLYVNETKIPFTDIGTLKNNGGYTTALTGGSGALADESDATYLTVARPSLGIAAQVALGEFAAYAGTDPAILVKSYFRASLDVAPGMGEEGPAQYYYNSLNTIYTYGSRQWRWKPTEMRMRTGFAPTTALPLAMVLGGSANTVHAPAGWGRGFDNEALPITFWGSYSGALTATIAEAGWLVYAYDDSQVPNDPADLPELEIHGQLDTTRVLVYNRRKR